MKKNIEASNNSKMQTGRKTNSAKKTATVKKTSVVKKKPASAKKTSTVKKTSVVKKKPASAKKKALVQKKTTGTKKIQVKRNPSASVKAPFKAYCGTKPYIFVSYSHGDMDMVFNIIKQLNKSGYKIWYDGGIEPGQEWPEILGKKIIKCQQFLVFLSPSAAKSRNVRNEIYLAESEKRDIIVVYLYKTRLASGIKLQLGSFRSIKKYETTNKKCIKELQTVLKK